MSEDVRPPYVVFETRSVEDRNAGIEAGKVAFKDVNYALITPSGSRDRIEKIVEEWFENLEEAVRQERFPSNWLEGYRAKYKAFLENKEMPEEGTSVLNWPVATPAQVKALLEANIRTVEDLSNANESALTLVGMGGRALKTLAQDYLTSAQDVGKVSQSLTELKQKLVELEERNTSLEERLAKAEAEKSSKEANQKAIKAA